jgi:hypothetical protein
MLLAGSDAEKNRFFTYHFFICLPKRLATIISSSIIMVRISSVCVLALVASSVSAFAPASLKTSTTSSTELGLNRRDVLNNVGLAVGGILAAGVPEASWAANPALETFKGRKKTKGSFIPGKGMRDHESYDELMAASNPALETFKGKTKSNSFYPGKGMRAHDDHLMAASNPALETFKGKTKANSFYPGKGMRAHDDQLMAASNPALETFKGKTKANSFYPGKGMRAHEDGFFS